MLDLAAEQDAVPSESESVVVGFFHAMRKAAKAERRRDRDGSDAIDRAVAFCLERHEAGLKANWQAERDAYDRQWS